MRGMLRTALTIGAASAALTACTDQPTSVTAIPRVPVGISAEALPTCNFTTLREAVRAYADVSGNDVIFEYIRDMSIDAYGEGMKGLARIADIRANGPKKSGAGATEGAAAVTAFLACMPVGAVQDGFATNIVAAMGAGGMFEVPGTDSDAAIFSRGETGPYFWSAKPDGAANWGSLTDDVPFMVFGYEINNGTGFDYNVVPQLGTAPMPATFIGQLVIGACGTFASAIRVNHDGEILFDESMGFCETSSPPLASLSSGMGANLASFARKSLSVFVPQTAFAFGGGVGGAVSELSPTTLPTVTPKLEYAPQPANNKAVGDALGIKVRVFTGANWATGTPLNNADVTLTVTGNSGLAALLFDPTTGKACFQVTRKSVNGVADFSTVSVRKAGGYNLTAAADFDNLDANPLVSDLFNVKNKKLAAVPSC